MAENEPKQERSRSPSYPYVDLSQAVELLNKFTIKNRTNRVQITIALKDMGYSMSGSGARVISALSQYGLIESDGSRENKRIWISGLGKSILFPNPSKPQAKSEAIRMVIIP